MGADTRILIPTGSRIGDVSNVIGVAVGLEKSLATLSENSIYLKVDGVNHKPSSLSECAHIAWHYENENHSILFHFQPSGSPDHLLLMPRSTAFSICLGKRLVDVFGGFVDYNDCDDIDVDYSVDNNPLRLATDGEEWDKWQKFMHSFDEITDAELESAKILSAYKR